jgi:hypothetical protein
MFAPLALPRYDSSCTPDIIPSFFGIREASVSSAPTPPRTGLPGRPAATGERHDAVGQPGSRAVSIVACQLQHTHGTEKRHISFCVRYARLLASLATGTGTQRHWRARKPVVRRRWFLRSTRLNLEVAMPVSIDSPGRRRQELAMPWRSAGSLKVSGRNGRMPLERSGLSAAKARNQSRSSPERRANHSLAAAEEPRKRQWTGLL